MVRGLLIPVAYFSTQHYDNVYQYDPVYLGGHSHVRARIRIRGRLISSLTPRKVRPSVGWSMAASPACFIHIYGPFSASSLLSCP